MSLKCDGETAVLEIIKAFPVVHRNVMEACQTASCGGYPIPRSLAGRGAHMLNQHIAVVPECDGIDLAELARVSAALQRQVGEDLAPVWAVHATVDLFVRLEDVPSGYWPLIVSRDALSAETGVHLDDRRQPYALVALSSDWSLEASRACLELLVNPLGTRTVSASSPRSDQGPAEVLLEICSACAGSLHPYVINDVLVSDFCTPAFFGPADRSRGPYSFGGAATGPMQLLRGGHLAWLDSISDRWWLRSFHDENPVDAVLGVIDFAAVSARDVVRRSVPPSALESSRERLSERSQRLLERVRVGASARAGRMRATLQGRRGVCAQLAPRGAFGAGAEPRPLRDARPGLASGRPKGALSPQPELARDAPTPARVALPANTRLHLQLEDGGDWPIEQEDASARRVADGAEVSTRGSTSRRDPAPGERNADVEDEPQRWEDLEREHALVAEPERVGAERARGLPSLAAEPLEDASASSSSIAPIATLAAVRPLPRRSPFGWIVVGGALAALALVALTRPQESAVSGIVPGRPRPASDPPAPLSTPPASAAVGQESTPSSGVPAAAPSGGSREPPVPSIATTPLPADAALGARPRRAQALRRGRTDEADPSPPRTVEELIDARR